MGVGSFLPRILRILLGGVSVAYLALRFALFFLQRSLLYFPQPRTLETTTIALPIKEARVLVSTRPKDGPHALIYFGGNAEDASIFMPSLSAAFPDSAIYLLHYRGYGGSSGKPSERALFADALMLFDEVRHTHAHVEILGRSLGSGIAVYVASQRPVARLVLVTPYDSVEELASRQFPFVPVKWILLDKFESWRYAPRVTAPTLILAAEQDTIIPRANTELLRTRFRIGIVSFKAIPDTGHNTISNSPEYMKALRGD